MKRRPLLEWLALIVFAAGLAAVIVALRSSLGDAAGEIGRAGWAPLTGAFVVFALGRGLVAVAAWIVGATELTGAPGVAVATAWLRSAVGKYLPGLVWQPLGLVGYLRRVGVTVPRATAALAVDSAATIVAALLVGVVAVPALVSDQGGAALWLLLALPVLALLHPRIFAFGVRLIERIRGREHEVVLPSWSLIVKVVALQVVGWVLAGSSLALVLSALGASVPLRIAVPATALSWVAGLLFLVVPAGLGVREAALVGILVGSASAETALAAAVISRVMFVMIDLVGVAVSYTPFVGGPVDRAR